MKPEWLLWGHMEPWTIGEDSRAEESSTSHMHSALHPHPRLWLAWAAAFQDVKP